MIPFTLVSGSVVWLVPAHIVSAQGNRQAIGSIIRMSNGDQWAVQDEPEDVAPRMDRIIE